MVIYGHKVSELILPKLKKKWKQKKVFCVVAFDPIRIQTCLTPQNGHQYPSFVKDIHAIAKKMTRNERKLAKCKGCDI